MNSVERIIDFTGLEKEPISSEEEIQKFQFTHNWPTGFPLFSFIHFILVSLILLFTLVFLFWLEN